MRENNRSITIYQYKKVHNRLTQGWATKKELLTITKENKHPQQVTRIDVILQIMKINKTLQTKTNADLTLYRIKCDY